MVLWIPVALSSLSSKDVLSSSHRRPAAFLLPQNGDIPPFKDSNGPSQHKAQVIVVPINCRLQCDSSMPYCFNNKSQSTVSVPYTCFAAASRCSRYRTRRYSSRSEAPASKVTVFLRGVTKRNCCLPPFPFGTRGCFLELRLKGM